MNSQPSITDLIALEAASNEMARLAKKIRMQIEQPKKKRKGLDEDQRQKIRNKLAKNDLK